MNTKKSFSCLSPTKITGQPITAVKKRTRSHSGSVHKISKWVILYVELHGWKLIRRTLGKRYDSDQILDEDSEYVGSPAHITAMESIITKFSAGSMMLIKDEDGKIREKDPTFFLPNFQRKLSRFLLFLQTTFRPLCKLVNIKMGPLLCMRAKLVWWMILFLN